MVTAFGPNQAAPSFFERFLMTRGFRRFPTKCRVELPEPALSDATLQNVLLRRRTRRELNGTLDLVEVGALLRQSLGCTAVFEEAEEGILHAVRAWPSAGGLYPLDAYAIVRSVSGLEPGVYYFNPINSELESIESPPSAELVRDAFFGQEFASNAAFHVVLAAVFQRTLSKYGERGYRLVLLDAGHAAQNLLLTAEQLGINAIAMGGYCDDVLNEALGLDGVGEAVVHALCFGRSA
jgi:SagB-type dehydrogenase family enzyme